MKEKFIKTLREEDDEDMESSDYTLRQALDEFCASLFGYEVEENKAHESKVIDGKRVIGIYGELPEFINPNLNCVFEKLEDPADDINSGINIINLDEYRQSQINGEKRR